MMRGTALVLTVLFLSASSASAGTLTICATHYKGDGPDFADEFSIGPITVPAGTVLDFAGHDFNGPMDPKDDSHRPAGSRNWVGISSAEQERRTSLLNDDVTAVPKVNGFHPAVITTGPVVLTKRQLCATVEAKAFVAPDWRDDAQTIPADPALYYQTYGVLRDGRLDTDFKTDSNPFEHAAARGEINAIVTKDLEDAYVLPSGEQSGN